MIRSRPLLIGVGLIYLGWLAWLAAAVSQKDRLTPLSRAQLTAATDCFVAEITLDDQGTPANKVRVLRAFRSQTTGEIDIINMRRSVVPGQGVPSAGTYLIPVVHDEVLKTYTVAGLPRSPGYESRNDRLTIYPWTPVTESQLQALGWSSAR